MISIQPYQEFSGAMCVVAPVIKEKGIASQDLWDKWVKSARKNNLTTRPGGNGRSSLIELSAIPEKYREQIIATFGSPKEMANPLLKHFEIDGSARLYYEAFTFPTGEHLTRQQVEQYTITASTVKAVLARKQEIEMLRKRSGNKKGDIWAVLLNDSTAFKRDLKLRYGVEHTLPESTKRLKINLNDYAKDGYFAVIDGRSKNKHNAKITNEKQLSVLEELLKKHQNFNNEQIKELYNIVATNAGWKTIGANTVASTRKDLDLFIVSGNSGLNNFRNTRAMQVKRSTPTMPLYFWTLDGWDVELLFQKTGLNKNGHQETTYHHRPTVVVVLDPFCNYPIGYAIGTHESPALIRAAICNAINHTAELFGERHIPHQIQSDNYGRGALKSVYEAVSQYYTPARVGNAKAKRVEPYFLRLNKLCQLMPNWSGFGYKSRKENQPNTEHLNAIRHSFPNEYNCYQQIERIIAAERSETRDAYLAQWQQMPNEHRLPLSLEDYLHLFGQTTGFTNRIEASGFNPTINSEKHSYDSFDVRFRQMWHTDWVVKYDPKDLSRVLAVNAERKDGKIVEIATHRFLLEEKYVQPMALVERVAGDAEQLQRVSDFNKDLVQTIETRNKRTKQIVQSLLTEIPALDDTLAKMVLCDSNGQHKNQRNTQRSLPTAPAEKTTENHEIIEDDIRTFY